MDESKAESKVKSKTKSKVSSKNLTSVDDIITLFSEYEKMYSSTRREQNIDNTFIEDIFDVPDVRAPHRIFRSGLARKCVDSPSEQIVTRKPQAFVHVTNSGSNNEKKQAESRLAREFNRWLSLTKQASPNPPKEYVKNELSRGVAFWRLAHNPNWLLKDGDRAGLPVHIMVPEPMSIMASPAENDCGWIPNVGVPNAVFFSCRRPLYDLLKLYPELIDSERFQDPASWQLIHWIEYWDKNTHYAEADSEMVFHRPNPYGLVPFIRKYSGFGKLDEHGDLASLIVSDIKFMRGLFLEETALRSDIQSVIHKFAHKTITVTSPGKLNPEMIQENLNFGMDTINILDMLPLNTVIDREEPRLISPEVLNHWNSIRQEIKERCPFISAGFPQGTSGRHQAEAGAAGLHRYDTVIENSEHGLAMALRVALHICSKVLIDLPLLHTTDYKMPYTCDVKLGTVDAVEESALMTLGNRMWDKGGGSIDLRTNHVEFQNRTVEESDDIKAGIIVDSLMLYDPTMKQLMVQTFAKEAQLEEQLAALNEGGSIATPPTAAESARTGGEDVTQAGMEQMSVNLGNDGARTPPVGYDRG